MSLSKPNHSAATITSTRVDPAPISGICVTCLDGCEGPCEIGRSALKGREMIYPQPFGKITAGAEKDYPCDFSHFNIQGTCVGAVGAEADPHKATFPSVDCTTELAADSSTCEVVRFEDQDQPHEPANQIGEIDQIDQINSPHQFRVPGRSICILVDSTSLWQAITGGWRDERPVLHIRHIVQAWQSRADYHGCDGLHEGCHARSFHECRCEAFEATIRLGFSQVRLARAYS